MRDFTSEVPYKPGQSVMCRVEGIEPGGYSATIVGSVPPSEADRKQALSAFLPSVETLKIGQTVPATFVCMHNGRALMTFAYMLGTTEKIQKSTAPDSENAFAIWVDSYPASQKTRRAIDLIMPSLSGRLLHELSCEPGVAEALLTELTLADFTGCIKARNEEKKSRSAMLIVAGRVCGAIYGRKDAHETFAVEQAMQLMREDLQSDATYLQVYELPRNIIYSMSALFLGCPLTRDENQSQSDFVANALMSMKLAGETGLLTWSADGKQADTLLFVHQGLPFAGYEIVEKKLIDESDTLALIQKLKTTEDGLIEAYLLPEQLLSDQISFGYRLTEAQTNGNTEMILQSTADFKLDLRDDIAVLWFDCEGKTNTLGSSTLLQLKSLIDLVESDDRISALVIASSKPDHFVFGADLHEIMGFANFDQAYNLSHEGNKTFTRLANLKKPVVAAVHGACLGGGLEATLCASARVAAEDSLIGLPEVKIGLMPGLGGTQRLPRLIAVKHALEFILTSEPVSAERALDLGIVDLVVSRESLLSEACRLAKDLVQGKWTRKTKEVEKPEVLKKLFATMERSFRIRFKGHYPAPLKAIEAVKLSQESDIEKGLEFESKCFAELAVEGTSRNLIQIFFSQDFVSRSAARQAEKHFPTPPAVLGIVGSGIMGGEIVKAVRQHMPDTVVRVKSTSPERAAAFKDSHYQSDEMVICGSDFELLRGCDMVVEAIVEEAQEKRDTLARIEATVSDDCVIATNTSSFELIKLGQDLRKPDRFVGLHYFYPVDKMLLCEVISHPSTSPKAVARALSLATASGKTPISVKDSTGFLVNRLLCTHLLEAARLLDEGIPLNWIEDAAVSYGLPMGPFTLVDELGLTLCFFVSDQLAETFGTRFATCNSKDVASASGLPGKHGGEGIYVWEDGRKTRLNEKFVEAVGARVSDEKPSPETLALLQDRIVLPMIDEAARCLEEKVVRKPRELDLALVVGTGFPAFRGGPLRWADSIGMKDLVSRLERVYALSKAAPGRRPAESLLAMQASGRRFYSSSSD